MILQLVPVLSMMFLLTSATGSALWAVHIEQENTTEADAEVVEDEDLPPAYTDEP